MPERGAPLLLPRLTALRAAAAVWVFLYHLGFNLRVHWSAAWFADGYAGVGFFFVLSGFVLTWTARSGEGATRFYRRRFARIYPTYAVATVIALVVTPAAIGAVGATFGLVQAWFALDPGTARTVTFPVNPPAWSLSCEAAFYLAFPLLVRVTRAAPARVCVGLAVAWALLCLEVSVVLLRAAPARAGIDIVYFTPLIRSGEFVLGAGLALAIRSGWRPRVPLVPALAALAAAAVAIRHHPMLLPRADLVLLPLFALVIVAAAGADLEGRRGLLRLRPLEYAGEISYAFYIVQFPVLVEASRRGAGPGSAAVIAAVATLLAAVALHHLVERPGQWLLAPRKVAPAPLPVLVAGREYG